MYIAPIKAFLPEAHDMDRKHILLCMHAAVHVCRGVHASSLKNSPNMVAGGSVCLNGEHFRPHGLLDWGADDAAGRTGRIGAHQRRVNISLSARTVLKDGAPRERGELVTKNLRAGTVSQGHTCICGGTFTPTSFHLRHPHSISY